LLILVNGSDGSLLDMWLWGGAGALARGYDCLTFDGPGQGYALWKQKLYFRPDWEKVISPVVDYALSRGEVDPKRLAIQGISQGGYWVPRAVAFEKRIAAAIADPGVVDVSTSWTASLPKPMIELLKAGRKEQFDG
jgi:cephalosporin-C deacetylase-like acetyl esterase